MRMHLPKPRAPSSDADRVASASSQVIRGRQAERGMGSAGVIRLARRAVVGWERVSRGCNGERLKTAKG